MTVSQQRGRVYVVATPIGNLEDLGMRALRVLREVALIACEDTRRTARLCAHFAIPTRRVSLHAHNEARRVPGLLRRLEAGESIALVSDAGTPLLSDPGARLLRAALERGFDVVPVPGPSAVLAALVASGLATRPFTFVGFLPRRGGARREWLAWIASLPGSTVLFEAPGRLAATLDELHAALGPRRVVIGRELTKRFEEIVRGRLGAIEVPEPRGEVTLVVEGRGAPGEMEAPSPAEEAVDPDSVIQRLLREGLSARDAARELARVGGLTRSEAYRRVLRARRGS